MDNKYICIHGHFYQPPRENAWLEDIEMQDSAYPYHDWNERIDAECYAPNTASRILDNEGFITRIVNNYTKISCDFGPTLLSWLQVKDPDVYRAIQEADRESQQAFSGHGSVLAQAYNHVIMPLANRRDKFTQVAWGMRDFEHRFKRKPEGMWLPETAVDIETLDILAEQGIKFTILAPHQAKRVRRTDTDDWHDVDNASIDPKMPYEIILPSGRKLAIFFYNGPVSRSIAFEDLLNSGDAFAGRLIDSFSEERTRPQLVHIATDGESYGHHHRFGDMALAYALHNIEAGEQANITNYAEYLERFPPTHVVEINENTSWSCVHGIERWRSDCGCNAGRNPKWNQAWRAPLREAMDWLRDALSPSFEAKTKEYLLDPWEARDDYIDVVLDRSPENIREFMEKHRARELSDGDVITVLKLMELQRHTMLMYTSCGWFFDELSGIETVQVIEYAGRAIQLAQELFGDNIENNFLGRLELAKSNIARHGDGRRIYGEFAKPTMVDLIKVAAHFAISSIFGQFEDEQADVYCYHVDIDDYQISDCGRAKLAAGKVNVTSVITRESDSISFGVLHLGDHNVYAGVRRYRDEKAYRTMVDEAIKTCTTADFPAIIRLLDKYFGTSTYSIRNLFRDEQRKVLDNILESALSEIEAAYHHVYEHYYPPMRFLSELGTPIPRSFQAAAEFILNTELRKAVSSDTLDPERIRSLLDEIQTWNVELDTDALSYYLQCNLEHLIIGLAGNPESVELLKKLLAAMTIVGSVPFPVDLWKVQNIYHGMLNSVYPQLQSRKEQGDEVAHEWVELFGSLGNQLSIRTG
jgi:alpha-amylase/alpha-mannosidase (GH57 family)